jgi:hypothetical protein
MRHGLVVVVVALAVTSLVSPAVAATSGTPSTGSTAVASEAVAAGTPSAADDGNETASVDHEGNRLTLLAGGNRTITGSTSLDPGETVQVRIQSSSNAPIRFIRLFEETVDSNGSFAVTLNTSGLLPGTEFTVTVRKNETLTTAPGVIAPRDESVSIRGADDGVTLPARSNATITVETNLPEGTRITVRLRSSESGTPFLQQVSTTVDDGTAPVAVNLSDVSVGASFTLTVRTGPIDLTTLQGTVVEDGSSTTTSADGGDPAATTSATTVGTTDVTFGTVPADDDTSSGPLSGGLTPLVALLIGGVLAAAGILWVLGYVP